jgi:hypothetical protein
MPRAMARAVFVGLLAAVLGGCAGATGYAVSVGDKTTLIYGWEDRFDVRWTADPESAQTRVVRGTVSSRAGSSADRMRVLVQASDASGRILAQRLVWLPTGISGASGTYFEAPGMPLADHYRVTVWDYTTIESVSNLP